MLVRRAGKYHNVAVMFNGVANGSSIAKEAPGFVNDEIDDFQRELTFVTFSTSR